jgi:hypothetical protein
MTPARIEIRPYADDDWDAIARIHDVARLDELRDSAGVEAFLTLAQTAENEGLFDGRLWVAEADGEVAGFVALDDDEVTWLYVDPKRYRQGAAAPRRCRRRTEGRGHRARRQPCRRGALCRRGIHRHGDPDRPAGRQ